MASDNRYMYQHPQAMETYEYQPYPSTSYETAHYPGPSARHPRPNGSHSHSPVPPPAQASYAPPPHSSYPSPYASPPYALPPPPPPQWAGQQQWPYPVHSSYAPPPQPPPVFNSPPLRADMPTDPGAHAPVPHRGVYTGPPEPARGVPSSSLIPDPAPRGRDTPIQNRDTMATTPTLDFTKLLDSMKTILEGSRAFTGAALPPQLEPAHQQALDSMLQHATFGYQMLDFASVQAVSPPTQQREERVMLESQEEAKATAKLPESTQPDGQTCLGCKATSTPEWRRGPMGPRTLCNACGLVYAKMIKKRGRERAGGAPISSATGDDSASAASEDGETYTTQTRRSQAGERR